MISARYGIFMGVLLLLGGTALVALNAYTTWVQGATWAVTDQGKWIISATIMTIEVVGVVFIGFAGGAALSAKRWILGSILTLAMLGSALVVVNSIASFQATERLSATKTHEAQAARIKDADKLQASAANRAMSMAASAESRGRARDLLKANQQSIADFRNAKTDVILEPDAGATLFAKLSGWTIERVQMTQAAYISVLQVILAMLCFHAAGFFVNPMSWGVRARQAGPASSEPPKSGSSHGGSSGSGGSGSREQFKPTIVHTEPPKPEPARASESGLQQFEPLRERLAQIEPPKPDPKPNGSATFKPVHLQVVEPPKVSNALARVIEPSVPTKEWSRDEVKELLRRQRDGKAPKQSSYQIADYTGLPQRTISRWQKRLYGQTQSRHRRYAGNGGGHHATVN
jgi:hypothetical protein